MTQDEANIKAIAQTAHPISGYAPDKLVESETRLTQYKDQIASKSVTDIDIVSNVATATCTAHGFVTGDAVTIAGAATAALNGTHIVTRTGANTFTYPAVNANVTNNTGTVVAALPAAWSAATVTDGAGNAVAATPITIVAAASLPDITA